MASSHFSIKPSHFWSKGQQLRYDTGHLNLQWHSSLTPITLYIQKMNFDMLNTKTHHHNSKRAMVLNWKLNFAFKYSANNIKAEWIGLLEGQVHQKYHNFPQVQTQGHHYLGGWRVKSVPWHIYTICKNTSIETRGFLLLWYMPMYPNIL